MSQLYDSKYKHNRSNVEEPKYFSFSCRTHKAFVKHQLPLLSYPLFTKTFTLEMHKSLFSSFAPKILEY